MNANPLTTYRHRGASLLGLTFLFSTLSGCAIFQSRTLTPAVHKAYYRGDLGGAEALLTQALQDGETDEESQDSPMLLMERGLIYQREGKFKEAGDDFRNADEQLEVVDFDDQSGEVAADYLLNANLTLYRGQPHEKILLNTLNILNFLQQGETGIARIAARRAANMEDYQTETEGLYEFESALTPLLFGLAFEASGETERAHAAYKEAFETCGAEFLKPRLLQIAWEHGFSDKSRWKQEFGEQPQPVPEGQGSVLVVVMNGRVPIRKDKRFPIPAHLLHRTTRGLSMAGLHYTRVTVPALQQRSHRYFAGTADVADGDPVDLVQVVDIETQALARFEQDLPHIISAAVTRFLVRYAAQAALREEGSALSNFIADLVQFFGGALDLPDLRCWSLLPAEIMVSLQPAPAGMQTVSIRMSGSGTASQTQTVEVTEGGIAVAVFFVTD